MRFFFFNDTATTEIYTLSLHDALPISLRVEHDRGRDRVGRVVPERQRHLATRVVQRGELDAEAVLEGAGELVGVLDVDAEELHALVAHLGVDLLELDRKSVV